ncbi:hypothetical protein N7448_001310 [Penicillium atrosanguineum]|uniref:Complex 1 LYR protein domain-containing protein n=1 Tax=Penicillium atrosanguineum TaxID=1132637 RepID=A0A9W9HJY7_9EURO|nr:Mg2+ transporter protein CorA-like/Zinc transport protein ZntB [Penicillium atrosanguineum]KAJ5133666.1 hypothetical protein N7526_005031 [Penicillium atrosanguineum]KAJ5149732.1 hypothetical protein N7448_001310 [Penicillium atrosanguineum]KAJ5305050.1 Mg2+ transporter protein CorA-like/Zinc transport protein ZntB [Penicillium atrosanguineum]KAJ5324516.1 hypothetical protein N7476_003116 [Penicillium atrosanguineum]
MRLDVDLINRGPRIFCDSFKIVSFTAWLGWWYQVTQEFIGLALYRALLRQCSPSVGNPPWLAETQSLIKQRFRRYRQLQSPSQAANSLKAGYKTLDLLDSASKGNKEDAGHVSKILSQAKSVKKQFAAQQRKKTMVEKPLSPNEMKKMKAVRSELETWERKPDTPSILNRPQPVSGRRKVPVLVNARGIPFLRIKKPQPANLSGVIRNKLNKRWECIEVRDKLQTEVLFAKDEDVWDRLTHGGDEGSWAEQPKLALDNIYQKIHETDRKTREMAENMWQVVLREREALAEEEKQRQRQA